MTASLPPKYLSVLDVNNKMHNAWYSYFFDLTTAGGTYQPLDGDLTAISGIASTGVAVRTAANTWTTRTITGTANKVDVTDGDGVSGNPTLTISATYVGQASITTLGTITTGTWTGTAIAVAKGGTGQTSYTNGQLLIGNTTGNTLTKSTLTAGTGITITNGTGSITIASTATSSIARTFMLMGG